MSLTSVLSSVWKSVWPPNPFLVKAIGTAAVDVTARIVKAKLHHYATGKEIDVKYYNFKSLPEVADDYIDPIASGQKAVLHTNSYANQYSQGNLNRPGSVAPPVRAHNRFDYSQQRRAVEDATPGWLKSMAQSRN